MPGNVKEFPPHQYKDSETFSEILDDIINAGVLDAIAVSDDGGLNISWGAGEVYTPALDIVEINADAGPIAMADDAINYLYWTAGVVLSHSTVHYDTVTEVHVATIYTQDGDIYDIDTVELLSDRTYSISNALSDMFPSVVVDGLVVSEHAAVNAFDVDMTGGLYYLTGHDEHVVAAFDSTATNIRRWYHDGGGNWTSDVNSQIDAGFYDTGAGLGANTVNLWYRSMFFVANIRGGIGRTHPTNHPNSTRTPARRER